MIREATSSDAQAIVDIYNHYIIHSHATFELEAITSQDMKGRLDKVIKFHKLPWLVMEVDQKIVGYAYSTEWKARKAYAKTTETSIYLHKDAHGKGYGKQLYTELLNVLKELGFHVLIGGVSLPNEASAKLHESLGFKKAAEFKEVGYKFDRWIDVGYWQLVFD